MSATVSSASRARQLMAFYLSFVTNHAVTQAANYGLPVRASLRGIPNWSLVPFTRTSGLRFAGTVDEAARTAAYEGNEHYAALLAREGRDIGSTIVALPLEQFVKLIGEER